MLSHLSPFQLPPSAPATGVPLLRSDCTAQDCDYEKLPENTIKMCCPPLLWGHGGVTPCHRLRGDPVEGSSTGASGSASPVAWARSGAGSAWVVQLSFPPPGIPRGSRGTKDSITHFPNSLLPARDVTQRRHSERPNRIPCAAGAGIPARAPAGSPPHLLQVKISSFHRGSVFQVENLCSVPAEKKNCILCRGGCREICSPPLSSCPLLSPRQGPGEQAQPCTAAGTEDQGQNEIPGIPW